MSNLDEINELLNNSEYGKEQEPFMEKTGFDVLDYLNGKKTVTDNGVDTLNLGIDAGKILGIIGRTGCGKSSLALQIGYNLIKNYENGTMIIYDFEISNSYDRIRMLSGASEEDIKRKVKIKNLGISTESVLKMVFALKDYKLKHQKELLIDNVDGIIDSETGKIKKILPPTVILIDSVAMMQSSEIDTNDISGQMNATSTAKKNKQLLKNIIQPCLEGNITVITINHINDKISTSITPEQAQTMYLSNKETVSGGLAMLYLTDTLIKLVTAGKLEPEKGGYGIKGYEVKINIVKSRTAPAGRVITAIFDQVNGYDNDLSILEYIKSNGLLKGNGMAYYLDGYETVKFKMSNFKEKLKTEKEFANYFYSLGRKLLSDMVKVSSNISTPTISEEKVLVNEEQTNSDGDDENA